MKEMAEDFIANCVVCNKGVTKEKMKFANGKEFHEECFKQHGHEYPAIDTGLASRTAKLKVDLRLG